MYKAQSGYYYDWASQVYLCGHRFYDSSLGRWLNRDPIGYSGGQNLYAYCNGNPVRFSDPSGLQMDGQDRTGVNEAISEGAYDNSEMVDLDRVVLGAVTAEEAAIAEASAAYGDAMTAEVMAVDAAVPPTSADIKGDPNSGPLDADLGCEAPGQPALTPGEIIAGNRTRGKAFEQTVAKFLGPSASLGDKGIRTP